MKSWVCDEIETADLGDQRLNERLGKVLEHLADHPRLSIPAACGGWSETLAAYRFFDNDKATFENILAPHRDATLRRMASVPVVLLVQDTTEDDDTLNLGPKGLGTIRNEVKESRRLHPTIAFTPERICLGVVKASYWSRTESSPRKDRRYKGIDEKESFHWVDSYQDSCALQGQLPATIVVNMADREGDIYEWFVEYANYSPETRAQWIVRATQNRRIRSDGNSDQPDKLKEHMRNAPALGEFEVEVRRRPGKAARRARVTVRSATVRLIPPARKGYRLPEMCINVVLAREENPPAKADRLEWLLLTSLPVSSAEQAQLVVEWYAVRWCIEVWFHVLKSGCQIKELRLTTEERQLPCLALYMIVAWRVLFTMMLGRMCPEIDCEVLFDREEWQAAYIVLHRRKPPGTPPSLGEVVIMVARLGGYLNRKNDDPPGPKAIWTGQQRLFDFVIALEAQRALMKGCV